MLRRFCTILALLLFAKSAWGQGAPLECRILGASSQGGFILKFDGPPPLQKSDVLRATRDGAPLGELIVTAVRTDNSVVVVPQFKSHLRSHNQVYFVRHVTVTGWVPDEADDSPGPNRPAPNGPGGNGPAPNGPGGNGSAPNGPGGNGPAPNGPGGNGSAPNGPGGNGPAPNGPGGNGSAPNGPNGRNAESAGNSGTEAGKPPDVQLASFAAKVTKRGNIQLTVTVQNAGGRFAGGQMTFTLVDFFDKVRASGHLPLPAMAPGGRLSGTLIVGLPCCSRVLDTGRGKVLLEMVDPANNNNLSQMELTVKAAISP